MTKAAERFIARVTRLEARYKGDKYATNWLMPRELMIALRDELKASRSQILASGDDWFVGVTPEMIQGVPTNCEITYSDSLASGGGDKYA